MRCASTLPPSAWRWRAARGGSPTRARTSTSWPRPRTRRPLSPRPSPPGRGGHGQLVGRGRGASGHAQRACRWTSAWSARHLRQPASAPHGLRSRHNEALRTEAVHRGLHVSEYGIAEEESGETHACATEEEVYGLLGMQWIPPELREDRGELQAAREDRLPELVAIDDIRGDLHCHTTASDGRNSIERDGTRRRATAATSTSRSPTTRRATASATTSNRTSCSADRAESAAERDRGDHGARRDGGEHPHPTARSTTRTTCSRSSTGWWRACTPRSRWASAR